MAGDLFSGLFTFHYENKRKNNYHYHFNCLRFNYIFMTREEALDRMLVEIRTKGISATEDYIPTTDHYIPLRLLAYYLSLAIGIGYDSGRKSMAHSKSVIQMKDGIEIKVWESQWDAEQFYKKSKGAISKSIKSESIDDNGFQWKR
jgi:hypothetical protein